MTVEQIFKEYPVWLRRKKILEAQIKNFKDFSENDIIKSLNFSRPNDERVQTSGISDKTAKIALNYKNVVSKESSDYYSYLVSEYWKLCENINFFEAAVDSLSDNLVDFIKDMVMNNFTWDALADKYNISHAMVGKNRKKAAKELSLVYRKKV